MLLVHLFLSTFPGTLCSRIPEMKEENVVVKQHAGIINES
jgi:hypothetical protein